MSLAEKFMNNIRGKDDGNIYTDDDGREFISLLNLKDFVIALLDQEKPAIDIDKAARKVSQDTILKLDSLVGFKLSKTKYAQYDIENTIFVTTKQILSRNYRDIGEIRRFVEEKSVEGRFVPYNTVIDVQEILDHIGGE